MLYEGPVSDYKGVDGLDWTIGDALNPPPSLEEAAGRDINSDEAHNCFSRHGTAATVGTKLHLEGLLPGVGCEACHGPGAKHVEAIKSGAEESFYIFNPKTLEPEALSQEFCGACHRGVDTVAMMPDLGGMNNVRFQSYRIFNSRGHAALLRLAPWVRSQREHREASQNRPTSTSSTARSRRVLTRGCCLRT